MKNKKLFTIWTFLLNDSQVIEDCVANSKMEI